MRHPCKTADGQVYERAAIIEWLQRDRRRSSPATGLPLSSLVLLPCPELEKRILEEVERRRNQRVGAAAAPKEETKKEKKSAK